MKCRHALGFAAANCRAITRIDDTVVSNAADPCFGEINAVWWKLLAVRAQVRSWKSDFFSKIVAARNHAENGVLTTEHFRCFREVAFFHRLPDGGAANHFATYEHGRNSDHIEIKLCAKSFEKIEIPASIFPKRPFVADADSPDPRLNEGLPFSIYAPRMRETSGRLRIRLRISSREASLICKTPIA